MRRRHKRILTVALIVLSSLEISAGFFIVFHGLFKSSKEFEVSRGGDDVPVLGGKSVLYITSRSTDDSVAEEQKSGMMEVFSGEGIDIDSFVMDTFPEPRKNYPNTVEALKMRMNGRPEYSAVVVGDDASLEFVDSNRDELFRGMPIVFMGLTQIQLGQRAAEKSVMTGSVNRHCIKEILDVAIPQNPGARYVTAIVDGSVSAGGDEEQFYSFGLTYPAFMFSTLKLSSMSIDELCGEVSKFGPETILIYISGCSDSTGARHSVSDLARLISESASIPVYTGLRAAVGSGVLGGAVTDGRESGRHAAATVVSIMNGANTANTSLFINSACEYLFDYSVAGKFGLGESDFPKNVVWVNDSRGFWQVNGMTVVAMLLILFGGILLVVVMTIVTFRSSLIQKELKLSRKQLEFMVSHDFLTGLSKIQTAHQIISEMVCTGSRFSVVKINISNFKGINNAYTHGCGDAVLSKIASLLMKLDQSEYFVARDGSEFIVIYRKGYLSEVSQHFERLRVTFLNIPFAYNGVKFDINTKMGIFNVPVESNMTDDEILSAVNYALYVAKAGGKYKYVFFTPEMQEKIRNNQEVVKILEEACENDGFEAFFQPQIDVESGAIFGYESLCRLKNHTISPSLFIPVAENNGFITKIGRIMTEKVVKQMASMRDDGIPLHRFAINYSAGQIVDTGYVSFLRSLLETYDIPPGMIEIEITESLYLGKDQDSASLFTQLEELGVGLALDDFGTGYSSISYLTYVPVGVVKIDKTMVDIYLHDGKDVLIKNIINMVHSLGMKLIAEGIEEEWQYQKLKKFNCDVIQGYYFSKPMRGSDVMKYSV